jgi:hypothetical protein
MILESALAVTGLVLILVKLLPTFLLFRAEAEFVLCLYKHMLGQVAELQDGTASVAVISPYKAQVRRALAACSLYMLLKLLQAGSCCRRVIGVLKLMRLLPLALACL